MKNRFFLFSAILIVSVSSCKEKAKENEPEVVTVDNTDQKAKTYEIAETQAEFNDRKMEAVFNQYLKVQAALVNTDAPKIAAEASKLQAAMQEATAAETLTQAVSAIAAS